VHSAYNSGTIPVSGSYPAFAEIRTIRVEEGRFHNEED